MQLRYQLADFFRIIIDHIVMNPRFVWYIGGPFFTLWTILRFLKWSQRTIRGRDFAEDAEALRDNYYRFREHYSSLQSHRAGSHRQSRRFRW